MSPLSDAETMSKAADEEERRILASLMSAEMERLARKHEMRDMSRDGDHSNAHVTPPDDHVTSHDVSSQDFMLFTDMFPFSEQVLYFALTPFCVYQLDRNSLPGFIF